MPSVAATLRTPLPDAGSLVRYGLEPELPDDATTMMPALAALSAATAVGSSLVPNEPPSDMLMTCIPWATAQSMPSMIASDGPRQPKTRTE